MLALWTLDAVASGRLACEEADAAFLSLFLAITDARGPGPELSDEARDLQVEWAGSAPPDA